MFFSLHANAQTEEEVSKAKARIAELLKSKLLFCGPKENGSYPIWCDQNNILVFDDRMVFKKNVKKNIEKEVPLIIYFVALEKWKITYQDHGKFSFVIIGNYLFQFNDPVTVNGSLLFNDFIFIQNQLKEERNHQLKEERDSQLVLFVPIAAQYRELQLKPPVSEEQRKYIVQANAFNEEKQYFKAIELYIKATGIDQTSYPAAYYNLALLSANLKRFQDAIYYMKKYLMLVPEAEDARKAQDKIYEWEGKIGK